MSAEQEASCHCGACKIRLDRKPVHVTECNCSLCAKLGWKLIYYASDEVTLEGTFDLYVRNDMSEPTLQVLRCSACGTPTHWAPLSAPPHAKLGINARLFDPALLAGVEVRQVDGRSWPL